MISKTFRIARMILLASFALSSAAWATCSTLISYQLRRVARIAKIAFFCDHKAMSGNHQCKYMIRYRAGMFWIFIHHFTSLTR